MLIVCPQCTTSYQVATASLGTSGRSVRCTRCKTVWFADPTEAAAEMADSFAAAFNEVAAAGPGRDPAARAGDDASGAPAFSAAAEPDPLAWPMPDADTPIQVDDSPPLAPTDGQIVVYEARKPAGEDIESIAKRLLSRGGRQRISAARRHAIWGVVAVLIALNAAIVLGRTEVVRFLPQMAPLFAGIGLPVNLRGLAFTDVSMVTQLRDGSPVLVVEGKIVSTGRHTVTVPRLRLAALSASRHEVYAWTAAPARSILSPGESTAFRSELPSPPAETSDVLVRFFHARDVAAGMK